MSNKKVPSLTFSQPILVQLKGFSNTFVIAFWPKNLYNSQI